jgi:hypothetical protein
MKTFAALLIPVLLLASCASMGSSNTKRLLSASGFQSRTPQNEKQQEIYEKMEPYKLYSKEINGKMLYAYKDPAEGRVYIGGPDEHQKYQAYATQQQIAQDQRVAAEMQMEAAYGWGAWSPYSPWWY